MNHVTFTPKGFQFGGEDKFFVSGEFHYYRVPKEDWRRRMRLFKEAGGNTLATYVPWLIHEPTEGTVLFGDVPHRDLAAYLQTAQEEGLQVVLRPGPYSYSELINSGMPNWLIDNYDQLMAKDFDGNTFGFDSISYLHPLFLEKVRPFFKAFADTVRPFMANNGGPVCMLQVDNEMGGVQIWRGSLDYNRETMGIGVPGGRYPRFLEKKFGTIAALNEFYNTDFADFTSVLPVPQADRNDLYSCRRATDYYDFYCGHLAEFALLLKNWMLEDGLSGPFCHNSANPGMNSMFLETVDAMGEDFLLGSDHYYTLNHGWPQNSPTPRYAIRVFVSNELLRLMGMPPTVLEMPGGSPSDTPPILKEDILACYRCNLAMGMKGVNYYIYTGGPNVPGTGENHDIYDYHAHIAADGSKNPHYDSLADFGAFMAANGWMQRTLPSANVQVGFEWAASRYEGMDLRQTLSLVDSWDFMHHGLLYGLFCSGHRPRLQPLDRPLDLRMPLLIPAASAMSRQAQENIVNFVKAGGHAILFGALPETDLSYAPCTVLRDFCGNPTTVTQTLRKPLATEFPAAGLRVYGNQLLCSVADLPADAEELAFDNRRGLCLGFRREVGSGSISWLGVTFLLTTFDQTRMLEWLLERDGAKQLIRSSNRNVMTTLWEVDNKRVVFAMNLYSAPQSTQITLYPDTPEELNVGAVSLGAMEVKILQWEDGSHSWKEFVFEG